MYINNTTENSSGVSGYTPANVSTIGRGISGSFFEALQEKMEGWVKAIADSQITEEEIAYISGFGLGGESADKEEVFNHGGSVTYDGSAAYLYVSVKIADISNLMSWMFNYISMENELFNKATAILTA